MMTRLINLRSVAIALFVAVLSLTTIQAASAEKLYYSTLFGTAVEGYDVVAYFTDGKPVEGSKDHSAEWKGVDWYFASDEHKKMFEANPEKYAPQYGGYCAWAVSQGYTASTVPEAWKIVDDKLYLNYSKGVQSTWEEDIPGNIGLANNNWPGIEKELK
ncbi:YHS domain-containing (seleno)protein [Sneathiella sp.]|uniref:YHS domain-containing (seleno)protein n=1 Tax=Sneathiella sp. TaxID=1964365 RepID=UPI0026281EBC|nr:YHS domain-containing (seleno)protein [Sneathiella sp.]MDF2367056.1 YHS domain-containing (seleno)protein [Sneathiella sp.]